MTTRDPELDARVEAQREKWWHTIDLGPYGPTAGWKSAERLEDEWRGMRVPPLAGKSVLDIGAWDGWFSFKAEREGAASVTSLDHYVWSFDPIEKIQYEARCRERGEEPRPYEEVPELWRPDELPGKRSFDLARDVLGSKVESVVADFMEAPLDELPRAEVVFFLGVLYHLKDPVRAFERLRAVTGEVAIVETEAVHMPLYPNTAWCEFVPGDGLYGDPTNWWTPNRIALMGMARAAGFRHVEEVGPGFAEAERAHQEYLVWAREHGPKELRDCPETQLDTIHRYRAVIHASV